MASFEPNAIPDVAEVRTGLLGILERNRVLVLGGFAAVVVGSLGLLAYGSVRRDREDAIRTEYHSIVDDYEGGKPGLYTGVGGDPAPLKDVALDQAKKLETLREKAHGTAVEPAILLQLALRFQVAGDDDRCLSVLGELKNGFPDSPVLQIQAFDSDRASLVSHLETVSKKRKEFQSHSKTVVPKPDLSRYALAETDMGNLKIVFYPDLAPKHVEAFVRQAKAGGFNGTQVYYVRPGEWIDLGGGDRTRDAEPRDDREDDPALSLPPEDAARCFVKHHRRTVTSTPLLSGDQEDRFTVVLDATRPGFDSLRTPFGELLDDESAGVADRLAGVMTYSKDATKIGKKQEKDVPNTPSKPVRIRRVSIWKEGVLDAGHTWDTARVNTDQVEPPRDEKK